MSFIRIRDLYKYYKIGNYIIKAVDGINLDIGRGEFVALLGSSGSGKSTLLNLLSGVETATKGSIFYNKLDITKLNEKNLTKFRNLNIGFVFQQYNLINNYSAIENTMLPLVFKGMAKKERLKKAKEMLIKVGLKDRLNNKTNELSGGQQQRVSIARALVGNPKILFADEPTGNLDSKTSNEIINLIKDICVNDNKTLIMVTHDEYMASFADTVYYMKDGQIEKSYTKEEFEKKGNFYGVKQS